MQHGPSQSGHEQLNCSSCELTASSCATPFAPLARARSAPPSHPLVHPRPQNLPRDQLPALLLATYPRTRATKLPPRAAGRTSGGSRATRSSGPERGPKARLLAGDAGDRARPSGEAGRWTYVESVWPRCRVSRVRGRVGQRGESRERLNERSARAGHWTSGSVRWGRGLAVVAWGELGSVDGKHVGVGARTARSSESFAPVSPARRAHDALQPRQARVLDGISSTRPLDGRPPRVRITSYRESS